MLGKHVSTVTELPKAAMLEPWMFVTEEFKAGEWIKVERKKRSNVHSL
jgi:hypothetical protein